VDDRCSFRVEPGQQEGAADLGAGLPQMHGGGSERATPTADWGAAVTVLYVAAHVLQGRDHAAHWPSAERFGAVKLELTIAPDQRSS
jgi:hypothetical protein